MDRPSACSHGTKWVLGLGIAQALYSGEYVLGVGLDGLPLPCRLRLELDAKLTDAWHAALIFTERPGGSSTVLDPDYPSQALPSGRSTLWIPFRPCFGGTDSCWIT